MLVGAVGFRWAATRYRYLRPHLLTLAGLTSMLLIASHFFNAGATSFHTMLVAALLELPTILHNIPWPPLDCPECCVPARRMLASAGICILLAAASIYRRLQLNPSQSSPATNLCGCSNFNFILPGASLPNQSEWQEFKHPLSARPQWRHVRTRACTDKRPKEYRWCPDGVCCGMSGCRRVQDRLCEQEGARGRQVDRFTMYASTRIAHASQHTYLA